jgi:hypothetical protein
LPRTLAEATTLLGFWPLFNQLPKGDGHPVLVLPGFAAGDDSTWLLRRFLTQLRYRSVPWLIGTNTGSADVQERLVKRMYRLINTYRQPITIIGQSLGGVFAREMARRFPGRVRTVITLGSPFGAQEASSTNPAVLRLFELMSGMSVEEMRRSLPGTGDPLEPVGVPSTAIFSRSDGVVQWQTCIEQEGPLTENIEIVGSHCGMSMNWLVFHVIADRLRQDPEAWTKFDNADGLRPWLFPKPPVT